jgi:hypothetical protein
MGRGIRANEKVGTAEKKCKMVLQEQTQRAQRSSPRKRALLMIPGMFLPASSLS